MHKENARLREVLERIRDELPYTTTPWEIARAAMKGATKLEDMMRLKIAFVVVLIICSTLIADARERFDENIEARVTALERAMTTQKTIYLAAPEGK